MNWYDFAFGASFGFLLCASLEWAHKKLDAWADDGQRELKELRGKR